MHYLKVNKKFSSKRKEKRIIVEDELLEVMWPILGTLDLCTLKKPKESPLVFLHKTISPIRVSLTLPQVYFSSTNLLRTNTLSRWYWTYLYLAICHWPEWVYLYFSGPVHGKPSLILHSTVRWRTITALSQSVRFRGIWKTR